MIQSKMAMQITMHPAVYLPQASRKIQAGKKDRLKKQAVVEHNGSMVDKSNGLYYLRNILKKRAFWAHGDKKRF
jgi:hypothetical protein